MQSLFRNYGCVVFMDKAEPHRNLPTLHVQLFLKPAQKQACRCVSPESENMMKTVLTIQCLSCIVKEIINVQ
jgi:hypothetical protein